MAKLIVAGIVIAVLLFLLLKLFENTPVSITVGASRTATLTHEQEIRAPYETARAELAKITPVSK